MKIFKIVSFFILFTFMFHKVEAQQLKKFGSTVENEVNRIMKRIPYTNIVSYLGYADPARKMEVKEGKNFQYIYLWMPTTTPELGVRMLSPTTSLKTRNPIIGEGYIANSSSKDFFDTYITLEKSDITSLVNVNSAKSATREEIAVNDDSIEVPYQPNGEAHNSLLRYSSLPKKEKKKKKTPKTTKKEEIDSVKTTIVKIVKKAEPVKPLIKLTKGLYRIGYTSYKGGEAKGTFLVEVASKNKLKGTIMATTIEGLIKQIK